MHGGRERADGFDEIGALGERKFFGRSGECGAMPDVLVAEQASALRQELDHNPPPIGRIGDPLGVSELTRVNEGGDSPARRASSLAEPRKTRKIRSCVKATPTDFQSRSCSGSTNIAASM